MSRRVGSLTAALLVAAALAAGCGGGGGGGSSPSEPNGTPSPTFTPTPTPTATPSPTPTPTPSPGIALTPGSATPPAIVVARGAASTATNLVLEVRATGVTGLYGVAFDLDYPPAALDYTTFRPGTLLSGGASSVSTQIFESAPGHLVVGISRIGAVPGVDGSGTLVELDLQALATGTGALTFTRNAAFGADGNQMTVSWAGGTVAVVR